SILDNHPTETSVKVACQAIHNDNIPRRFFVDLLPDKESSIDRGISALKNHRDIEISHRPPLLNEEETRKVLQAVNE
ncbi:MAG: hypothetical protein EZS28_028560, partial [Streblomastix strix]